MDFSEKALYHQIHPLKLLVDWGTGIASAFLLWQHRLTPALVVGLIPPILISTVLLRWANLEGLKDSPFGRYVGRYMTREVEAVRLAGMIVLWAGAWYYLPVLPAVGIAIILAAWARGKLLPARSNDADV